MDFIYYVIIFCSLVLLATLAVMVLEIIGKVVRFFTKKPMASYKRRSIDDRSIKR
jgi:hypothetical protein